MPIDDEDIESSPLHEAALRGRKRTLRRLLEQGADADARWRGFTPLMLAAMFARAKTVRLLLQYGADASSQDPEGCFPLLAVVMVCSDFGRSGLFMPPGIVEATIRSLVEHGADINQTDRLGFSALMVAARDGDAGIVRLLLSLGASADIVSRDGITALSVARAGLEAACRPPVEDPAPYRQTIELLQAAGATR